MKKTIVTVIAGLFATAAFAQTPAPDTSKTSKPQVAMFVKNSELKASKATSKAVHADPAALQTGAAATPEAATPASTASSTSTPTHAKDVKTSAKHVKSKTRHVAKADTAKSGTMKDDQDSAAATPAQTPAAPLGQDAAPAPTPVDTQAPAATAPAPDAAPAAATPAPAAPVNQ